MDHIGQLSRSTPTGAFASASSTTPARAEVLDAPESHSASTRSTKKIPDNEVRDIIAACRKTLAHLDTQANNSVSGFHREYTFDTLELAKKARPFAAAAAKRYSTKMETIQKLIHETITKAQGGVLTKFPGEYKEFRDMLAKTREEIHLWQATDALLGARMANNQYNGFYKKHMTEYGKEELRELHDTHLKLGKRVCELYAKAADELSRLPGNKEVPMQVMLQPFLQHGIREVSALRCDVLYDLCFMETCGTGLSS